MHKEELLMRLFLTVSLVTIAILSPPKALADFKFDLGNLNFSLTPFVTVEEQYDDNIYLLRDERSDWITTIYPGFNLSLLQPNATFDLSYSPGFVYYLHNPQEDYTSHIQNFGSSFKINPQLTFSLRESYMRTDQTEFEETLDEEDIEAVRLLRREGRSIINRISFTPEIDYRFGEENLVSLSYRNTNSRSEDPEEDDYREQNIDASLACWFNAQNGMSLLFNYGKGNFDIESDLLNSYGVTGRYMHKFTPHLEVYGEGSTELTDFAESEIRGTPGRTEREDSEDEDIYRANVGFSYSFSPTMQISGSLGYFWQKGFESDEDGLNSMVGLTRTTPRTTLSLNWTSGYETEYYTYRDAGSYEYWNFSASGTYNYSSRLIFGLRSSYGYRDYTTDRSDIADPEVGREDYVYRINASASYQLFRHINLELLFDHEEDDSNITEDSYIVNRVTGRITASY